MKILALDSTAVVGTVALCEDTRPIALYTLNTGNTHSQTLLPMIESALRCAEWTVDDVELFAVSQGPGSFTGVRIGVATVKGLAFGKGKTVIGVSTLEAMARNLLPTKGLICPVMNARRGQVYNALFFADGDSLTRLCPDRALAADDLAAELRAREDPFYLIGDGVDVATAALGDLTPLPCPTPVAEQNAAGVALAAYHLYEAGVRTTDRDLSPIYLRLPQAERERLEKEQATKKDGN